MSMRWRSLLTRCVAVNGFSLHAATRIKKGRWQALEQLIRYTARGPFSHKRLTQESDGDLRYTLKTPWNDGTIAIALSPEELIEKLAALVPIPMLQSFFALFFRLWLWRRICT